MVEIIKIIANKFLQLTYAFTVIVKTREKKNYNFIIIIRQLRKSSIIEFTEPSISAKTI